MPVEDNWKCGMKQAGCNAVREAVEPRWVSPVCLGGTEPRRFRSPNHSLLNHQP